MTHPLTGTVVRALVAPDPDSMRALARPQITLTFAGVAGDRHAGLTMRSGGRQPQFPHGTEIRNTRQISLISAEEMDEVAAVLGVAAVTPEALGANLLLAGIPRLTLLPPGTRLLFEGGAALVVEGENGPCTIAGAEVQADYPDVPGLTTAFPKAAHRKRGLVAWVECPGVVTTGARVEVLLRPQELYTP